MAQFWITTYSYYITALPEEVSSKRDLALKQHKDNFATVLMWLGDITHFQGEEYEVDGVKKIVPHTLIEEVIWGTHPGGSTFDYKDLESLFVKYPTTPDHPTFTDNPISWLSVLLGENKLKL